MFDRRFARTLVASLASLAIVGACLPLSAQGLDEPLEVVAEDAEGALLETPDEELEADASEDATPLDETEAEAVTTDEEVADEDREEAVANEEEDVLVAQANTSAADQLAARNAGTLADGRYVIKSALDETYSLDVRRASRDNGATIILYTSKVSNNQRWEITNVNGGYITIKSVLSGKYLQAGYDGKAFAVVQNARSDGERGQLWIAVDQGDGTFCIVSAVDTSRVLDVRGASAKDGAQVIAYAQSSKNPANQRWTFAVTDDILDAEATAHKGDLADGTYNVTSALDGTYALSLRTASKDNGTAASLTKKASKQEQSWIVKHVGVGYVTITNAYSGKVLDVRGGVSADGKSIIQWAPKSGTARNQLWIAAKGSDGSIKLTSALASDRFRTLAVYGGSAREGASIVLALRKGSSDAAQRWTFAHPSTTTTQPSTSDVADGVYQISTMLNTGKSLDVAGASKKEGAGVKLWTTGAKANQYWTLSHDSEGYVHLTCVNSGLELSYASGALKQSATPYPWAFEKVSNGVYKIRDVETGKYLDVSRSNVDNKTNKVILYAANSGKNQQWKLSTPSVSGNMPIMGTPQVTQAQAVRYINSHFSSTGKRLPTKWTNDGETVAKLVKYFWEEGAAEGVRGDIALAQSIHETGWFQFGNLVKPDQYNFAGLGATGPGHPGNVFPNARTGIRAQIQHLKAYASTAPLNQARVDVRFDYVERGCAPTIAGLSGKWAVPGRPDSAGLYYHDYLIRYLNDMLAS